MSEETTRKYRQLLLAIGDGYPRESCYETALRFIKERVKQEKVDQKKKTVNRNNQFNWKSNYL